VSAALLLPVLAACSSSTAPAGTAAAPVSTSATPALAAPGTPPAVANATNLTAKPMLGAGKGTPPDRLVRSDLVAGTGPVAGSTSRVKIHYVGVIWNTGREFDASWDRGAPDDFSLVRTITGFGLGIDGMKVGGRRQIVIPPALGYGPRGGSPPVIAADDTLVFVVDLLGVEGSAGAAASTGAPATGQP
jgi:peptidylprolyl isomerase